MEEKKSEPYAARCEDKASGTTSEIGTSVDQAQKESLTAGKYSDRLKMAIRSSTEHNRPKFTTEDHDVTCETTDDFFTNFTVYYADEKQEETVQAKGGRNRSLLQKYAKRSKKVEKCEDIFIGMKEENPNLLLTGDPGVGKTLFCEKAIRDWSMDRLFQNENSPNIKFAFLLKFHHFSKLGDKTINLQKLLNCSPLLDSTIDDSLFECLTNKPSEVLILLDGFHEYSVQHREQITSHFEEKFPDDSRAKMPIPALVSKLMRGKLLGNAFVLVTTRPGAVDELREISFGRYVEVSGFSPEQVIQFVKKYFSHHKELTRNMALEFVENTDYEKLVGFCHIPLTSFTLGWCLELRISQPGITGKLPPKTTELYSDVVETALLELLGRRKDFKMSVENAMKIVQDMLDKLAKIADNLTKEGRYIFDEEDMKKEGLSEDEIERLKVSGILHCTPGIQNPIFQTENEFRFLHLTLQEWLSASFCVKNKVIPGKNEVSGQTFVFMSGLFSNERDGGKLMTKLIEQIAPRDEDDDAKLLMLKCLYEYADDKLTKQTINDLYHKYCDGNGWIGFHGVTDVDMVLISYLLDIIRSVQPVRGRALFIRGSSLTSFGVRVLLKSLRSSFITEVDLSNCSLDDESQEEIINVLPNTGITRLNLHDTTIIKLTKDGGRVDIPKNGVFLQFPRKTVESPTQVVCRSSHENIPSPEADMMETLVSHLVQLGPSTVELRDPVTVTLLHAGPGKKSGYETVVKAYHHDEQVWKEIEVIQPEFKDTSYIPKNFKADNLIQVKISKLTPLAVISRLITDTFEVTPTGCVVKSSVCENVTVTFPEGAVDRTVHGSMKLVLVPEMIFLINGFEGIQFLKPVTVKFPYRSSTDDFPGHLRVLFQEDTVPPEDPWNDVTHDVKLEKKEPGFLELQVQHFSRWRISSYTEPIINFLRSPQHVFLGAFKRENDPGLKLTIVCGSILRVENNNEEAAFIGNGYRALACSTKAEMRINQKAYLNVEDHLNIIQIQPMQENFYVEFLGKDRQPFQDDLVYNIDSHPTTANMNDQIFLCFYPNIEYVEEERIGRLAITRCRLYPEPEGLQRLLDIDPEPPRNENSPQNSFVKPTRLEHIPHENKPSSDLVYKMKRSPRGISYIFNMKNFSSSTNASHGIQLDERCGSESDVESLCRLFEALDFTVQTFCDLHKSNLMVELQNISGSDFTSYDCLVVFIMSHGNDNHIYASDGEEVRLKAEIFDLFQNSKCNETFQGKPKLFFIQACRGMEVDPGVVYDDSPVEQATSQANETSDLNPDTYQRDDSEYCDNLYAYSCFEGHKSFRWKEGGGFYVNYLVKVFREHAHDQDVLSMLTMINDKVSKLRCEWGKQMPCFISTLRKKVFFGQE